MDNNEIIIYKNYDTAPKLFGIFNYVTVIISIIILIPLLYLTYNLPCKIAIKIYIMFTLSFSILIINILFADVQDLHLNIFWYIKYFFAPKIYIYEKDNLLHISNQINQKYKIK